MRHKIFKMKNALLFSLIILFSSCFQTKTEEPALEEIPLKYASHIKIFKGKDFYTVKIRNPWDTLKILHSYIITDKNNENRFENFKDFTTIKTPIENALIFTSLHASLVKNLGCKKSISSLCDVQYVLDKELLSDVKNGKIKDLGSSMTPDVEKIILQNPEIIMLSPYQTSGNFGTLGKIKIPLIECADYMENSPLAQAEWIKFYGLIFNKLNTADSIFSEVEKNYLSLKELVKNTKQKPKLLPNSLIGGLWYIPSEKSTAGRFYIDAGFDYPFNYLDGFGTVPLNFETVFEKAHDADIWIVKYNREEDYSATTFSAENANYQKFKAFKNKNVFVCNTAEIPYYDQTPFFPDLLLKDLIKISHPELFEGYNLMYFKKLE